MSFSRVMILSMLAAVNTVVTVSGLWFSSASISEHNNVPVFGVEVPGYLLGFMVVYIGVRAYIKLIRLMKKLKNPEMKFSWQNFKGGI